LSTRIANDEVIDNDLLSPPEFSPT